MAGVKGRSGRRPLPLAQHLARGTYRRDRHGPLPPGGRAAVLGANVLTMPEPAGQPVDMSGAAFVARVRSEFQDWTGADLAVLTLAGQQMDRLLQIRHAIAAIDLTADGASKPRARRPPTTLAGLLRLERQTTLVLASLLRQLNLQN